MSSDQNESNAMEVDQDQDQNQDASQPGTSSTTPTNPAPSEEDDAVVDAVMRERVRRLKRAQRAVDAYVNNILYEMMTRSGIVIPREDLEQGFEDFCQNNTSGLRVPDQLRRWWNLDDRHRRHGGPSEE